MCTECKTVTQSVIADISTALPPIDHAQLLMQRGLEHNFGFKNNAEVAAKVREELAEVEEALAEGDPKHVEAEIGDLLHAATAMAVENHVDASEALALTNRKWANRFRYMERALQENGSSLEQATRSEQMKYWEQAKRLPDNGGVQI